MSQCLVVSVFLLLQRCQLIAVLRIVLHRPEERYEHKQTADDSTNINALVTRDRCVEWLISILLELDHKRRAYDAGI